MAVRDRGGVIVTGKSRRQITNVSTNMPSIG